jgi:WhiB family transcriptional regulator, redox-sensing transcriptional regulator
VTRATSLAALQPRRGDRISDGVTGVAAHAPAIVAPDFVRPGLPCQDPATMHWWHAPDRELGTTPEDAERAKQRCQPCPVRVQCRQWAIDNREQYGVWGATLPSERGFCTSGEPIKRGRPRKKAAVA